MNADLQQALTVCRRVKETDTLWSELEIELARSLRALVREGFLEPKGESSPPFKPTRPRSQHDKIMQISRTDFRAGFNPLP